MGHFEKSGTLVLAGLWAALTMWGCGIEAIPFNPDEVGYEGPFYARSYKTEVPFPDVPLLDPIHSELYVFYPNEAPPESGYPVVLYSGGWNQEALSYVVFAKNLAQWGFVSIIKATPSRGLLDIGPDLFDENREHVQSIIAWLEEEQFNSSSPLFRRMDLNHIGLAGHSVGGSLSIVTASEDPRIEAVVSMDALFERTDSRFLDQILEDTTPTMHQVAELGGYCTFPPFGEQVVALFNVMQGPMAEIVLKGADHLDYDPLSEEGRIFCPSGTADEVAVRALASKYMVTWFQLHLTDDKEAAAQRLSGPSAQEDVAANSVAIHLNYAP